MTLNRFLQLTVGVLASALVFQVAYGLHNKPQARYVASWKHSPTSLEHAKELAENIVSGTVVKIEHGPDLVVSAPGEPNAEDRIPTQIVTVKADEIYKRHAKAEMGTGFEIKVFRTGSPEGMELASRPQPTGPVPPKPPGGVERRGEPLFPSDGLSRTILLEDDPPYRVGERVHLLLEQGPKLIVGRVAVRTERPISPEGRFHVTPDNKIIGVSKKAFVRQLMSTADADFKAMLRK